MKKIGKLLYGIQIFVFISACFLGCDGSATHSGGPTTPSAYTINLSASHTVVRSGGSTVLTAVVYNDRGERVSGVPVVFTSPNSATAFGTNPVTTGSDGTATVNLTITSSQGAVTAVATVENVSVEMGITVI